jgi:hypothetical protein
MTPSATNSCILRGKFDFAVNSNTGLWTTNAEVWLYETKRLARANNVEADYGYSVIETRNKVRGRGKALVLRFESSDGKDFELLGWGVPFEAETRE